MNNFIRMKSIKFSFLFFLTVLVLNAQTTKPERVNDSLSAISLKEVLLTGIRAKEDIPVTYTNVTREDLAPRNFGTRYSHPAQLPPRSGYDQ